MEVWQHKGGRGRYEGVPYGLWPKGVCMIFCFQLIRREMSHHLKAHKDDVKERSVNAAMIDFFLWDYTKAHSPNTSQHPIHRTLTIFY